MSVAENNGNQQTERQHEANSEEVVSKLRSDLSQILACSSVNLFKLSSGLFTGYTTLVVGDLYKENSEIKLTIDQLTWYGSYCFTPPVGALLVGLISRQIGNRKSLLFTLVIYFICWILYYYVTDVALLLTIQTLVGLTIPVAFVPGASYVAEVTQPHLRSIILASGNLHLLCGSFLSVFLGTIMHWRKLALVNLIFPTVTFIAIYFIPESPHWLASKGHIDKAEKSMAWLRGWTTSSTIRNELSILKYRDQNKSIQLRNFEDKPKLKDKFKPYLQRSFIAPLLVACSMFIMHSLTGSSPLSTYAITIFDMLQSPVDSHVLTVIYDALRIVGAIVCILIIKFIGKRSIMFTSVMTAGSCYFIITIFHILIKQHVVSSVYTWVPTIALEVATFSTSFGIDKLVFMYNVELFPSEFRNVGSGIAMFIRSVMISVVNKIFFYLVDAITLEGVFILFGIINLLVFASFYFLLPETNGKTLTEIEQYFIDSKKSRKKNENTNEPHSVLA